VGRSSAARLAVAVDLSGDQAMEGPGGERGAAPPARNGRSASCDRCGEGSGNRQASDVSNLPPFLCHSSARAGTRHPNRAGAPGPPGRLYDNDRYPRPAPRRTWCPQSARHTVSHITPRPDREATPSTLQNGCSSRNRNQVGRTAEKPLTFN